MRRLLWSLLFLAGGAALAVVLVPTVTIQPFKAQTTTGVAVSYALKRAAPAVTAAGMAVALACSVVLWSGARRWWRRGVIVAMVAVTGLVTWFARQNHFEWMFNPLGTVEYVGAADARTFLVDAEIVMGIEVGGEALAYPIRQLAYHHLVNDVVGGTPLVATY
jgi:hypothetical protein